jgi:hypothetical protein
MLLRWALVHCQHGTVAMPAAMSHLHCDNGWPAIVRSPCLTTEL